MDSESFVLFTCICLTGSIKTLPTSLLAAPVISELMNVQATITGLLWDWRRLNMMFLRQVLHIQGFCFKQIMVDIHNVGNILTKCHTGSN